MALISEIGQAYETCGEVTVEWKIPDFFSLSGDVHSYYQSPVFFLSDSYWRLWIYPNGTKESPGWVGLYLKREDSGPSKKVSISVEIKRTVPTTSIFGTAGPNDKHHATKTQTSGFCFGAVVSTDQHHATKSETLKYNETESTKELNKFILISDLHNERSQLAPSGVLTLICNLKRDFTCPTEVSLTASLWNLGRDLRTMLVLGEGTDFSLKVKGGRELRAHRKILDARCGYFTGMLANDFKENASGVADIDDIEDGVLQCILNYLYTGEVEGMADRNVCKIYVAADKLLLEEVKKLCVHYMKGNLNGDLIYDVIVIAEKYDEAELKENVVGYIDEHAMHIFDSDCWKKFCAENSLLAAKFLEKIIVRSKTK